MSYALEAALTNYLENQPQLTVLLAERPGNHAQSAIYPYHHHDVAQPAYPLITIARFGSVVNSAMFSESETFATMMDGVKLAVCSWSKTSSDEAIAVMAIVRRLLRNPTLAIGNQYFSNYKLTERLYRDDLFDQAISAYHVHTEYSTWVQEPFGNPQPIPEI